jgi:hypothetical protein
VSAPDWMREDVRLALDALGPRWCEDQLVMDDPPESVSKLISPPEPPVPPLTLWDEL